nr:RibD C-terminal domain protein [uncultured bacterium]
MKVFLIAAVTADGYIARHGDHAADWTSKEDKQVFVRLTKEAGVMVMGSRTFATINRALPERRTVVYSSKPDHITVPGIEVTNEAPGDLVRRLEKEGANGLAVCGGATIYDLFMQAGVVDELYLTVEPVTFGRGITLFNTPLDLSLKLLETEQLGSNSVLLHYQIANI